jgi:hypothetical protein
MTPQVSALAPEDARRSSWMAAAQCGKCMTYEALLRDYVVPIQRAARRIDDVVQETLLTVHRRGTRSTRPGPLRRGCTSSPSAALWISCGGPPSAGLASSARPWRTKIIRTSSKLIAKRKRRAGEHHAA